MAGWVTIIVILSLPVLWQVPRTFWRVHLDGSGSAFTGLYRRYSVATVTGYVSGIKTWSGSQTVGSVSAQTSGMVVGGVVTASTSINDRRRTFVTPHTEFFLTDANGATSSIDSVCVSPTINEGHLVSVGILVHGRKQGNAFIVCNHTTNQVFVEDSTRGIKSPKNGLVKMVFKLPVAYQVILFLRIVTIPLIVLLGLGAHWQVKWFRRRGIGNLTASLDRRAAEMPRRPSAAAVPSSVPPSRDLATQIKDLTDMHESGRLSVDEFQAAKARLLGT